MAATLARSRLVCLFRPLATVTRGHHGAFNPPLRGPLTPMLSTASLPASVPATTPLTMFAQGAILKRVRPLVPSLLLSPSRSLTYYSVKYGKRKSCRSIPKRFLRLHCGLWLRRKAGYKKKLWKKMPARRNRLRDHVFCNKTQSRLLDKMTGKFWKRRNWFLNDPYLKYHDRVNKTW